MVRSAPPVLQPDAREEAEWFQRLPEHAKSEFRERWRAERGRSEKQLERHRRSEVRYMVEGVLLFAGLEFLFFGLSAGRLLVLAVPGVLLGWICSRIRANRWTYAGVGVVFYLVLYGLLGLFAVGHFIVFLCVAAALGFTHEMLRADGSEGS